MVTECAEGLRMQSLAEDLGWKAEIWLWTDSSAAKAIGNRRGFGQAPPRVAEVALDPGHREGGPGEAADR